MNVNISKIKTQIKIKDVKERISNFDEIVLGYSKTEAIEEAKRCLNCKNPTCIFGCPANNDIPLFIHHIKRNNLEEAYNVLRLTSNMPEICSRVCDHSRQCEKHCVRAKNGEAVGIGMLERYICDNHISKNTAKPQHFSKKVAVIGSGPAGLSCAEELNKLGYLVTVFEAENEFGGLLTYGIPNYRLPYNVVKNKISTLKQSGIEFINNRKFGKDFDIETLKYQGFAAIFIAIGAPRAKYMGIPGEEAEGLLTSTAFLIHVANYSKDLREVSKEFIHGKVAVIGGGNSAIDAARCALRLPGVERVEIIYRRTRNSMPAALIEIEDAIDEGVILNDLTLPVEILKENGRAKAIKCIKMYETEVGADGRRSVKPIEGSEFVKEFDYIIYAIGNETDEVLTKVSEISLNKWKTIEVDDNGKASSDPLIYAAGDVVTGPSTVVSAVANGKKCAIQIDKILKNI